MMTFMTLRETTGFFLCTENEREIEIYNSQNTMADRSMSSHNEKDEGNEDNDNTIRGSYRRGANISLVGEESCLSSDCGGGYGGGSGSGT